MDIQLKRNYNKQDLLSTKDIVDDFYIPFLTSHDRKVIERKLDLEVGQFLKVFNILSVAKYKKENTRGKPSFLYPRKTVEEAFTYLREWMGR